MSTENEDVSSIIQSFVESELASLDNAATHTDSLELNSKYAEPVKPARASALTGPPRAAPRAAAPARAPPSPQKTAHSTKLPAKEPAKAAADPAPKKAASVSSSSVETNDTRRASLGDKFKIFGRRITSQNSK